MHLRANLSNTLISEKQKARLEELNQSKNTCKHAGKERVLIVCYLTMIGKTAEEIMGIMNYKNKKTIMNIRSDLRSWDYLTDYELNKVGGHTRNKKTEEVFNEDILKTIPPHIINNLNDEQQQRLKKLAKRGYPGENKYLSKLASKEKFFEICYLSMVGKNTEQVAEHIGRIKKIPIMNIRSELHKSGFLNDQEMAIAKKWQ